MSDILLKEVGQALLERHEVYVRRHEVKHFPNVALFSDVDCLKLARRQRKSVEPTESSAGGDVNGRIADLEREVCDTLHSLCHIHQLILALECKSTESG